MPEISKFGKRPVRDRPARNRPLVTLKHVAAAAGVTPMTVSNVLNRRTGAVGPETHARVLEAVERLGYRPHAVARRLRSKRYNAIGTLVLDDAPEFLSDPFTTNVIAGLGNFATEHGNSLVLQGVRSADMERAPLLLHVETDGVCAILSGSSAERARLVKRLARFRQPLVLIQEGPAPGDTCSIRQDDRGGASLLAKYLLGKGVRRMLLLLPTVEWPAMVEREQGFKQQIRKHGGELRVVRSRDEGMDATQEALRAAIRAHGLPDAVLGGNDRMAIAALKLLAEEGVSVPGQVRVTGFNGFESARYSSPELTTVRSPAYEMGRRAGQELLKRVETGRFAERQIVLPVSFIPGASA